MISQNYSFIVQPVKKLHKFWQWQRIQTFKFVWRGCCLGPARQAPLRLVDCTIRLEYAQGRDISGTLLLPILPCPARGRQALHHRCRRVACASAPRMQRRPAWGHFGRAKTLVISRIDFRNDHCKWKILGKVDGSQNIHHEVFSPHLANYEILLQSGARWQIWGAERSYLHKHWFPNLNKCLEFV